ncbi:hypothetical protein TNCV_2122271 [Trichonephila clavipes]|nr:hypothetical protein TNCV_2122271 [Trichonephila clavipes]
MKIMIEYWVAIIETLRSTALTAFLTSALFSKRLQAKFFFKAGNRLKSLRDQHYMVDSVGVPTKNCNMVLHCRVWSRIVFQQQNPRTKKHT